MSCGKQPRYQDGVEEIRGRIVNACHPTSGYVLVNGDRCEWMDAKCPGWLHAGADVLSVKGQKREYPNTQPCGTCNPGFKAVWDAGLARKGWEYERAPRALYRTVTGDWPHTAQDARGRFNPGRHRLPVDSGDPMPTEERFEPPTREEMYR